MSKSGTKKDLGQTLREKIYFVAAVGTDIGKTFLVENLCKILPGALAIKPVVSGFREDDPNSDPAKILAALGCLGVENSKNNLDQISPWRFAEAVSPHFAAQNCGAEINFAEVKNFCQKKISEAKNGDRFLFIEAAGGVMTPLCEDKTFLDLAAELQIPVLLLTANYLGAISHTLCAVEALRSKKIVVEKIIVNEDVPLQQKSSASIITTIKNLSAIETISLQDFLDRF